MRISNGKKLYHGKSISRLVLSFFLVITMLLSSVSSAFAGTNASEAAKDSSITVYFTLSEDGKFVTGKDSASTVMARVPIEITYFDLANYGLQDYTKTDSETGAVVESPTLLHLYITALEKYYLGGKTLEIGGDALSVSGSAGSMYMTSFWGHDANLMYFVNHEYPLESSGWGATADRIALKDGDEIDVAMYADYNFYSVGAFTSFDKTSADIKIGDSLKLQLRGVSTSSGWSEDAYSGPMAKETVKYSTDLKSWTDYPTVTDAEGYVTLDIFKEPGTYYISAGPYYNTYPSETPAVAPPIAVITVAGAPVEKAGFLSALKVTNGTSATATAYSMTPEFSSEIHEYTITIPDSSTSVALWATLSELAAPGSTITAKWTNTRGEVKTQQITSGKSSGQSLSLALATKGTGNTVTVEVASGGKTQNYVINIVRTRSLSALTASMGNQVLTISPAFKNSIFEYTVDVPESAASVTVNPTAYGAYAEGYEVKVQGEAINEGKAKEVVLTGAKTAIDILVYHKDGTQGSYTLTVNRVAESMVTFKTTPENALVYLVDSNGVRIPADSNGQYTLLSGNEYTYTITAASYIGQKNTFKAESGEIEISLDKAPENTAIIPTIEAEWKNFRGNDENNAVVEAKTPTTADESTLYWATKYGDGWDTGAPSSPILVDGYLVFTSRTSIVKMDTVTGKIVATGNMVTTSAFNITPPTYADGMIFVALSNGIVQAFNADTLESLWIYRDPLKGQPNSPIAYKNGYIYTGFWNGEQKAANLVALSVTDEDTTNTQEEKLASWTYEQMGGFYWAGAYVSDNYLLVGTDDGESGYTSQTSNLLSLNPKTGEVIDQISGLNADIRSSISYDKTTDRFYFTSKGGSFYSVKVDSNGIIDKASLKSIDLGGMSTSTPVVYNGRAYVGVSGTSQFGKYSGHNITVIDLNSWSVAYTCATQGYPQTSGLLTTAYEKETGYVYIYFIDNYTPGKIRIIKDKPGQKVMEEDESLKYAPILFTPKGAQAQYAICSPIVDEYGTLYFKNDSAHLMALGSKIESIEVTSAPGRLLYKAGDTFEGTGMKVIAHLANGLTKDITDYVSYSTEALTTEDTDVTIKFTHVLYQDTDDGDNSNDENNIGVTVDPMEAYVDITVLNEKDYNTVINVIDLIDNIGEVDINSQEAISKARTTYDGLNEDFKALVNNYDKLIEAEKSLDSLKLTVQQVIDLIDAIGEVNSDSGEAITTARMAYDNLSEDLKEKITNYDLLTEAEKEYAPLKEVATLIEAIPEVNKDNVKESALKIQKALEAYNTLTEEQRSKITNISKLNDAIKTTAEINHSVNIDGNQISVEGLEWNIKLVIEDISDEARETLTKEAGDKGILALYDIHLIDMLTGENVEVPEKGIIISFTLDKLEGYENFKVLHLIDGNILEVLTPVVNGNTITASFKSLSPVAIVANTVEEEEPIEKEDPKDTENKDHKDNGGKKEDSVKTGDSFNPMMSISFIIASALAIILLTHKKTQATKN